MPRKVRTDAERFFAKVDKQDDGCWRWTAARRPGGAGIFDYQGRNQLAHRASCHMHGMPVQPWHCVHHTCRNAWCVNPEHLQIMTRQAFATLQGNTPPQPGMVRIMRRSGVKRQRIHTWVSQKEAARIRKEQEKRERAKHTKCLACDVLISVWYCRKKYCSAVCRLAAYSHLRHAARKCVRCHTPMPFRAKTSYRTKYCSTKCRHASQGEFLGIVNPARWGAIQRAIAKDET